MFNSSQSRALNDLIAASNSIATHTEGRDVLVFTAQGDLESALTAQGFIQTIKRDKFGQTFGHCCWWNETEQLLVLNVPRLPRWTISTEVGPLTSAEYAMVSYLDEEAL